MLSKIFGRRPTKSTPIGPAASFVISVISLTAAAVLAQSNCPPIQRQMDIYTNADGTQMTVQDQGVLGGASIDTEVVDNSVGQFSNGTDGSGNAVQAISTAESNYASAVGATVQTTNTDTVPPGYMSNTNPMAIVHVVQQATQAQINAMGPECSGASACTATGINANGFRLWILTSELPSVATGATQEQFETHEDSHGIGGFADCNGCAQTAANPTIGTSSPSAPTNCDKQAINPTPCPA